jgi:hypothetical protein
MPLESPSCRCAVIFAKKGPLAMEDIIGFNARAQLDEQDDLDMENIEKEKFCDGKYFFHINPLLHSTGKRWHVM